MINIKIPCKKITSGILLAFLLTNDGRRNITQLIYIRSRNIYSNIKARFCKKQCFKLVTKETHLDLLKGFEFDSLSNFVGAFATKKSKSSHCQVISYHCSNLGDFFRKKTRKIYQTLQFSTFKNCFVK